MKKIALILLLFSFTSSVYSESIEEQIRKKPEMSEYCKHQLDHYQKLINKYESIPSDKRSRAERIKLGYFKLQLQGVKDYCKNPKIEQVN